MWIVANDDKNLRRETLFRFSSAKRDFYWYLQQAKRNKNWTVKGQLSDCSNAYQVQLPFHVQTSNIVNVAGLMPYVGDALAAEAFNIESDVN